MFGVSSSQDFSPYFSGPVIARRERSERRGNLNDNLLEPTYLFLTNEYQDNRAIYLIC